MDLSAGMHVKYDSSLCGTVVSRWEGGNNDIPTITMQRCDNKSIIEDVVYKFERLPAGEAASE